MPHKAFVYLLLLIVAMQPVLAFGQFTTEPTNSHSRAGQMAMMDCCDDGLHGLSEPSEQDMVCGDMASADCTLVTSFGSCGAILFALVPEKACAPTQSATSSTHLHPLDGYLSIILDTLTPPPNASKA